ncbi:MAG TPA: NUDIX domain-containing protein [Candidatus Saccharimonadales bacterium]|nr:NUDIX domain-containing protein [Candidatus Saccharimonadales bacterium]
MKYAPREVFEQILEWAVIPTFDLVIEIEDKGYLMVRRTIEPYKNVWALPGLRMYKDEGIDDTLIRIARQEVGIDINPKDKVLIGQFVGKFKTEHQRQDLSTGYYLKLPAKTKITINKEHFSAYLLTKKIPDGTGAMYKHYINRVAENKF